MGTSKVDSLARGLAAGLAATFVLSLLIVLKQALGIMPGLNLVTILAHALGYSSPAAGWLAHYIVGVLIWGPLYAWWDAKVPFPHLINGLMFASVIWWGVMLIIMPLAGEGLFGIHLGLAAPTVTLMLHWAYGAVLGLVYGALQPGVLMHPAEWHWPMHRAHHA
jgi:hypothetical protein